MLLLVDGLLAVEFVGKAVGVIEGSSIRVMHEGSPEQIRLPDGLTLNPEILKPVGMVVSEAYRGRLAPSSSRPFHGWV
ncbi:MAG: hypothetical protein K0S45_1189 [Nitrospira sp.]|nr:hypothetical protein [Nitrospira sp.]